VAPLELYGAHWERRSYGGPHASIKSESYDDIRARVPDHPARRIAELLPWNWKRDRVMLAA
jgi:hypothetical protein